MKNIINSSFLCLAIFAITISSCSVDKSGSFTSRKYTNFDNSQAAVNIKKSKKQVVKDNMEIAPAIVKIENTESQNNVALTTTDNKQQVVSTYKTKHTITAVSAKTGIENKKVNLRGDEVVSIEKSKTLENKQSLGEKKKPSHDMLLLIILSLFPITCAIAVYLVKGISTPFWIDVLLHLTFIGAMIYALYIVLTSGGDGGRGNDQRRSGAN